MRIFLLSTALLIVQCIDSGRPTSLFPGLKSYSDFESVKSELGLVEGAWTIVEDTKIQNKNGKPFHYFVVEVMERSDLGISGSLQLDFYNERLMNTWFYPSDSAKYKAAFKNVRGIRIDDEFGIKIKPNTVLKDGRARHGRYYVGWLDAALNKEKNTQVD